LNTVWPINNRVVGADRPSRFAVVSGLCEVATRAIRPCIGIFVKALLIKGSSAYGVLRLFIDDLADAFRSQGWDVQLLDIENDAQARRPLGDYADDGPFELVFSFGLFGEVVDEQGRSVGEMVGAPHVIQYVDYPLSHLTRLEQTSPHAALLMIDESHAAALKSLYPPDRFAAVRFSPHAAIGATVSPGADADDFAARRPIRLLLPASPYGDPPVGWRNQPAGVQRVFEQAVEIALAGDRVAPLDALDQAMTASRLDPSDPEFTGFRKLATYVHEHVRSLRRRQLLEAVIRLGLPVHIAGGGHDPDLARHKTLTLLGAVGIGDILALMAASRVVLNANANFVAGSHERPLSALNAGAVPATDPSAFYAANFEAGAEMAVFRWSRLEQDLAAIGALAEDPEAAFAIASAGQRRVVKGHLWAHRIDGIIAAADEARGRMATARGA
jgi:Glycosyl transferases group 1